MARDKLKLLLLILMTAVPIALATWLFKSQENQGLGSTTNNGRLIVPVLDLPVLGMRDEAGTPLFRTFEEEVAGIDPADYRPRPWMLVYLGGPECDAECEERLYYLRQLHRRLAPEDSRVQRWYLNAGEALDGETGQLLAERFPELAVARADPQALRNALAPTVEAGVDPVAEHYIYVVDPVGNVMLYFTPANTPEEILEDIDKLLERSSLG